MYTLARLVGVTLMVTACLTWLTYEYPDMNVFRLGGGGILNVGLGAGIGMMVNWFLVCVQAAAGWFLFTLKPKGRGQDPVGSLVTVKDREHD